jgi:hypothetical protein
VWDGFQWIKKGSATAASDPTTLSQTKRMRRVQISNLPLYLGLQEDSISKVVNDFLVKNYLADPGNPSPVIACEINKKDRSAIVELSSVEEANRFTKLPDMQILNVLCKITRLGESMYGTTTSTASILQQANVGFES